MKCELAGATDFAKEIIEDLMAQSEIEHECDVSRTCSVGLCCHLVKRIIIEEESESLAILIAALNLEEEKEI